MGISIIPTECFNLTILRHAGDAHVDVTPAVPNHQWFAAQFTDLPLDVPVTIRLCMTGNDTPGNQADCTKWVGLRPLLTYADPARYEAYEWFRRDARGRWVSGDPFKQGAARFAGSGPVPEQDAVPAELAAECLTADGEGWFPWREMEEGRADIDAKTFTLRCRFARPTASLAIHVPYTVAYQQAFLQRLRAARFPGVAVDDIGLSAEGRPLSIIRVDDPAHPTPLCLDEVITRADGTVTPLVKIDDPANATRPRVFFVIAREHGTEHTPSWLVQGLLRRLLADTPESQKLRRNTTWLLLPIYDPDGAANSVFHALTDHFFPHENHPVYGSVTPPEVVAYARYLRAYVNSGRVMAAVSAFYGLECNEGPPVLCPHVIAQEREVLLDFNSYWFSRLKRRGLPTGLPRQPWRVGWTPHRLHGWCWYWYGALTLTFEINDRYPEHRLGLPEIEEIGGHYADTLVRFLDTPAGKQRLQQTRQFLDQRKKERDLWFRTTMSGTPDDPTVYDILSMGY